MPNRSVLSNCNFTPLPVTRRLTDAGKRVIREVCIHFVDTGNQSRMMRDARRYVQESGLCDSLIRDMDEQYVLRFLRNEETRSEITGIFVLEHFSGVLYEELRKRQKEDPKCRLVHPLTIFQSKRGTEMRLPFKPHPLRSLAMSSVTGITLSGDLAPDERSELSRQILLMGGAVFQNVSPKNTSIVVGRNMSDSRCVIARGMEPAIPIVAPEWIEHCYKQTERDHVFCALKSYPKYTLAPFAGLTLSPAQIDPELRRKLAHSATKGGYQYQPDLRKDQTTHLICMIPEGEKWSAANSWEVYCVSYGWVTESFKAGYALPEKDFMIGQYDGDNSFDQFMREDRFQRKRASKDRRSGEANHMNPDVRRVRRSDSPPATSSHWQTQENTPGPSALTQDLRVSGTNTTANAQDDSALSLEPSLSIQYGHLLDVSRDDVCEVFDGMEFGLVSCDADKADFLKKLITNHSGYLDRAAEDLPFIIVGKDELDEEAKDLMERFKSNESSAIFVSYKWVIASAERGSVADMEPFQFGDRRDDDARSVPVAEQPNLGFKVTQKNYAQRNRSYKDLTSTSFGTGTGSELPGDDALINEYSRRIGSTQPRCRPSDLMSETGETELTCFAYGRDTDDTGSFVGFRRQQADALSDISCPETANTTRIAVELSDQSQKTLQNPNRCPIPDRRGDQILYVNSSDALETHNQLHNFRTEPPAIVRRPTSNARRHK